MAYGKVLTRKFDGKVYKSFEGTDYAPGKKKAEDAAKFYRDTGSKARIVKLTYGYRIYHRG